MGLLNWIIAFVALIWYFANKLETKEGIVENFNWKYYWIHNAKDIILGFTSVVLCMLVFTQISSNVESVSNLKEKFLVFQYIPMNTLAALVIGLLNKFLVQWISAKSKKKIKSID